MNADELREALDCLSSDFPELGELSLYYIGNVWHAPYCDDRSWAIALNDWRTSNRNHSAPHNFVIGSTTEMEGLTVAKLSFKLGKQIVIASRAYREATGERIPPAILSRRKENNEQLAQR